MGSVAVVPMLFADSCRSIAVTDAASAFPISVNKHLNKHAFGWCCRSSNNTNAGETISSTTVAGKLTATSSSNSYPKYDRLLPCPTHKSPPRIEHLVVSEGGPVLEYICKVLDLPHL
ncbi:RNA pseudourine synthase 6 chloroplastic-like [Trifolium pratense]|uniref:RNA pseudourine synthase 6 chloroplastic-like n=1 Tax=Trifolium pratense TaxID=57577 RepID=A0A2K3N1N3_TRIPR|nr:RNA pseudourine synthase 6 chloroplastic-like [Trifolium pratense]